jgi:hypothetical protein
MCRDHPAERSALFCRTDHTNICAVCAAVGAHRGHDCSSLSDYARELTDSVRATAARLTERVESAAAVRSQIGEAEAGAAQVLGITGCLGTITTMNLIEAVSHRRTQRFVQVSENTLPRFVAHWTYESARCLARPMPSKT